MKGNQRIVVVDVRNGQVRRNGSNIDVPPEGVESMLSAYFGADVLIEVGPDGIYVKKGVGTNVLLISTKSELQMNDEKAAREKSVRLPGSEQYVGKTGDRDTFDDDPVDKKFPRVWRGQDNAGTEVIKGV